MSDLNDPAKLPIGEIGKIIDDPTTSSEVLRRVAVRADLNRQHLDGLILHPNVTEEILATLRTQVGVLQGFRLEIRLRRLKCAQTGDQPNPRGTQTHDKSTPQSEYSDYSDYSDNYDDWNDWYGHR